MQHLLRRRRETGIIHPFFLWEVNHLDNDQFHRILNILSKFTTTGFEQLARSEQLAHVTAPGGNTILHYGAAIGESDGLASALQDPTNAPPIDATNSEGYTALQMALMRSSIGNPIQELHLSVKVLLEAGADPRLPSSEQNAIVTAALVNCPTTINMLYCNMRDRESCKMQLMLRFRSARWPLGHFIWTKDLELMKLYLDSNPRILKYRYKGRDTPALHQAVAARAGPEFFELLMAYSVDINCRHPTTRDTALHRACELAEEWVNHDVVEKMLALGANPSLMNSNRQNCLHLAARAGSEQVVKVLLRYNVENDTWDSKGKNAMHYAAAGGSVAVIAALQDIGLNVRSRCRSNTGEMTIHLASYYCRPEAVEYLIKLGLNPNAIDFKDKTPLYYAVKKQAFNLLDRRCTETVDILIEHGADLYHEISECPLKYCIRYKLMHNASILIRYFALEQPEDSNLTEYLMNKIRNDETLDTMYTKCLGELEAMKEYKLSEWITVHNILTDDEEAIRPLMRNSDLVKEMFRVIVNRIIHQKFPLYATKIVNRFTRYEMEQRKIRFACEGLADLFSHLDPSGLVAENVLKYLDDDLELLIEHRIDVTVDNMLKFPKDLKES